MAAGTDCAQHALHIGGAIFRLGQEMKRRAIMPEIVGLRRLPGRNIVDNPFSPQRRTHRAALSP
jgi:hypothetical protein